MRFILADDAAAIVKKVRDLVAAGDISSAIGMSREALNAGIEDPLLLNLRAYAHEQSDDLPNSLADLERAHSLAPTDPVISHALAICLGKLGQWERAIVLLDQVIAIEPNFAPAHYNKGWNSEFHGDLETAAQCYEKALALQPGYPEATSRIAALAARRAAWPEAKEIAGRALALDSAQFLALQTLIRAALGEKDHALAERLIDRHLSDSRAGPLEQAIAYGYLGDLRHAQGRFGEAFTAYTQGNARQIEVSGRIFRRPGVKSAAEYASWLADYVETAPASEFAAERRGDISLEPDNRLAHVFLVGSPRSGTTLLENILISHPRIVSLEERPLLKDAVEAYLSSDWGLKRLATPLRRDVARHRALYWDRVRRERVNADGKVFVDKHPLNLLNLAVVAKIFPQAKVLFAVRDPRDVVLSCFRHTFLVNRSMFEYLTLEGTARFYDILMRISMIYREKLNLDWCEVRNENLVHDFEREGRKICDFIGVEWDEEMKNFGELAKSRFIATPSATQVMRGINREGMGQWRNYAAELAPVLPILKPWIERFGYDSD